MHIVRVDSENEYRATLAEITRLVEHEPDRGTPEGSRLDALSLAAEAYEAGCRDLALEDVETR
jgi:antitoxin component HigA of HigAB toxin-antitoxin module